MKRILGYLAGIAIIAAVLATPALFWDGLGDSQPSSTDDPTSFSRYDATFDLASNGDLRVTERIRLQVDTSDRHGLYRFWDRIDPNIPTARRMPHDITVTRDGSPEPFSTSYQDLKRFFVAKIGDPDVTLSTGAHDYVITYRMHNVIIPGSKAGSGGVSQPSAFFWDVIPGGWQQNMSDVNVTVNLPVASADPVGCAVGFGSSGGCQASGAGTKQLTVHFNKLPAKTPVSLRVGLDMATPAAPTNIVQTDSLPWSGRWDYVIGDSRARVLVVALLGIIGAVAGGMMGAKVRETQPPFPLMYAPPDGLGPAQATFVLKESVDTRQYVATLMDAASKDLVKLDRNGDDWTVTNTATNGYGDLDPVGVSVIQTLVPSVGDSFSARRKNVASGKALQSALDSFKRETKTWAISSGNLVSMMVGTVGGLMVIGALILVGVCLLWNPAGFTMSGLIPGAFAVCGISLLGTGAGTMRTRVGRDLWSRIGGFERILSTPSSKDRFDFSGRQEAYTAFIPWAVAFDCADQWANKYRVEMGTEPPVPSFWAGYYVGASTAGFTDSMVDSFSSTISSATSSYAASQRSSSGGGGGGFGGGGGGGGGGGSW